MLNDGTVYILDIGCGLLTKVAESRDGFAIKLDDGNNGNEWLLIPLVDQLVALGRTLQRGQCYGFVQPPVLGGAYSADNVGVLRIDDYYGGYGSIQWQITDLPDGSHVEIKPTTE